LDCGSRIEGIGRPRVEASFLPDVIDAMVKVPDAWSVAAMRVLSERLGRRVGPSTGTNLLASLACARQLVAQGQGGAIVTLLCDSGERYRDSYFDAAWCERQGLHDPAAEARVRAAMASGWSGEAPWRQAGFLA
jgi:cysteine synthase A